MAKITEMKARLTKRKAAKAPRDYSWLKNILEQDGTTMTDKQKAIVKAAVDLFSEKGYAATSTREIAQTAGVSEGSIFKLYPTKKELMLGITRSIIDHALFPVITSGFSELFTQPFSSREEFLIAFFRNRLALVQEGLPLFKIIVQELPFQQEIRGMLIEQVRRIPLPKLVGKLQMGENSDLSDTDVIHLLLTCIMGFFFLHNIIMPELFSESQIRKDAVTLARFMSRGLMSAPGLSEIRKGEI